MKNPHFDKGRASQTVGYGARQDPSQTGSFSQCAPNPPYKALGEREQALPRAEQALAIFEAIEDPNAAQVRAALAQWRKS